MRVWHAFSSHLSTHGLVFLSRSKNRTDPSSVPQEAKRPLPVPPLLDDLPRATDLRDPEATSEPALKALKGVTVPNDPSATT